MKWDHNREQRGGSRIFVFFPAAVVLLLGIAVFASVRLNTSFAVGYSKAKFDLINLGDGVELVLTNMGLPLQMTVNFGTSGGLPIEMNSPKKLDIQQYLHVAGGNLVFHYSACLHRCGDQYRNVNVTFTNGCVQAKHNEIYHEWW